MKKHIKIGNREEKHEDDNQMKVIVEEQQKEESNDKYHGNDDHIESSHQKGMSDMQDYETIGGRERYGSIVNIMPNVKSPPNSTRNLNLGNNGENNPFLVLNSQSEAAAAQHGEPNNSVKESELNILSPKTVKNHPTSSLTQNVIEEHKGTIFEEVEKEDEVTPQGPNPDDGHQSSTNLRSRYVSFANGTVFQRPSTASKVIKKMPPLVNRQGRGY